MLKSNDTILCVSGTANVFSNTVNVAFIQNVMYKSESIPRIQYMNAYSMHVRKWIMNLDHRSAKTLQTY